MSTGDATELHDAPPLVGGGAPEAGRLGRFIGCGLSIPCPGTSWGKHLCSGLGKGLGGPDAVPCMLRLGATFYNLHLPCSHHGCPRAAQLGSPLRLAPFKPPCPLTCAPFQFPWRLTCASHTWVGLQVGWFLRPALPPRRARWRPRRAPAAAATPRAPRPQSTGARSGANPNRSRNSAASESAGRCPCSCRCSMGAELFSDQRLVGCQEACALGLAASVPECRHLCHEWVGF